MTKTITFSEIAHFLPKQLEATKVADEHTYTLYGGSAGPGKAIRATEIVATPFGFRQMKDLKVGDTILAAHGGHQKIIAVHPQGVKDVYRVNFNDETYLDTCAEHLWKVRKVGGVTKRDTPWRIMTTRQLIGKKQMTIPFCSPLKFTKTYKFEMRPIDPYLLGVLLGDGCLTQSPSFTTSDQHIVDTIKSRTKYTPTKWKAKYGWGISPIKDELKKLGLYKTDCFTKFVPKQYLWGDIDCRRWLMKGLIDTDGTVDKDGGLIFYTTSSQLSKDVTFIARSLGARVKTTIKYPHYTYRGIRKAGAPCFVLSILAEDMQQFVSLPRKSARLSKKPRQQLTRKIDNIEHVGEDEMICITVDDPGGLFIAGEGLIVTHNSYWLRWYPIRQMIRWGKEYGLTGIHGALFSHDYTTLKDRQVSKMDVEFPRWLGEVKNTQVDGLGFHLKPEYGSHVLALRNLDDPSKYLSSEFAIIAQEEVTENEEDTFHRLRSRLRWTGIPNPKWIGATNPGGIGHEWVKKLWIDRNFPDEMKEQADQFAYVKALPADNPYLSEQYLATLDSMPEKLRKAYRDGNWDVFEGQYFTEWDREVHVCKPFAIPATWRRYRSIDPSGRSGVTACHWYALDSNGEVWVYREYHMTGLDYDQHADNIARLSKDKDGVEEPYPYTVIDTSAFAKAGYSETAVEIYERHGVTGLIPADKERVIGWNAVHQYLRHGKNEEGVNIGTKLHIFETCPSMIRTIPLAQHDELHPEDVADIRNGAEHGDDLDDLRYFLRTLKEQKSQRPLSKVEQHLQRLKRAESIPDYSYTRN